MDNSEVRRTITARIRVPVFHTFKVLLNLDLDVDASRQVKAHEHVNGF